jgi:hypothetical protein
MLGDGTMEKGVLGYRFRIQLMDKFEDVANFYKKVFYNLGYSGSEDLGDPKQRPFRASRPNDKPYYAVSTFFFRVLSLFIKIGILLIQT